MSDEIATLLEQAKTSPFVFNVGAVTHPAGFCMVCQLFGYYPRRYDLEHGEGVVVDTRGKAENLQKVWDRYRKAVRQTP